MLDFAIMNTLVSVIMGSRSDWAVMEHAINTLEGLGIAHDVRILSAHRTPEALTAYMAESEASGTEVFIGAAGGAAHLAGVMAAQTVLPVLGVPMESKLQGCADAGWNPGGYLRRGQGRRRECDSVRGGDSGGDASRDR
jgi:phosphoribosylcarboxyaminoimidazole (NCAIR) mutase